MAKNNLDVERYWLEAPPEPSPGLKKWLGKIENGWRPNSRISAMGYYEAAEFYQVYIWEFNRVLRPLLHPQQ